MYNLNVKPICKHEISLVRPGNIVKFSNIGLSNDKLGIVSSINDTHKLAYIKTFSKGKIKSDLIMTNISIRHLKSLNISLFQYILLRIKLFLGVKS